MPLAKHHFQKPFFLNCIFFLFVHLFHFNKFFYRTYFCIPSCFVSRWLRFTKRHHHRHRTAAFPAYKIRTYIHRHRRAYKMRQWSSQFSTGKTQVFFTSHPTACLLIDTLPFVTACLIQTCSILISELFVLCTSFLQTEQRPTKK